MDLRTRTWWSTAACLTVAAVVAVIPDTALAAAASVTHPGATAVARTTDRGVTLQPWPVLREGPNSLWSPVAVRSLQSLLAARGEALLVDGVFGPRTKAAVVAFQRSHGLAGGGVVGSRTWRSLIVIVRPGSTGQAVRAVQDQINSRNGRNGHTLNVDGIFGRATEVAVRDFQKSLAAEIPGFRVDGIVGPWTWRALVTGALSI